MGPETVEVLLQQQQKQQRFSVHYIPVVVVVDFRVVVDSPSAPVAFSTYIRKAKPQNVVISCTLMSYYVVLPYHVLYFLVLHF